MTGLLKNFWLLLTMACVVWYCSVTVYVAIRGAIDIRGMLGRLRERGNSEKGQRE